MPYRKGGRCMAWEDSFGKLPSRTWNRAAGVAMLAGLFALGVGIGCGCTSLMIAAGAVIFIAGLVPAAVDCRDAKRRPEPLDRTQATPAAIGWHVPKWDIENIQQETSGGRLVWIEPQADWQRLH
jgi:hypothetical protein